MNLPHENVYVRLGKSPIHGIGVFAILKIEKGTPIFYDDAEEINWVDEKVTDNLPEKIQDFYEAFCIHRKGQYGCPPSFNKLTPNWYINHNANDPNVGCDANDHFFALRDILVGEEITYDYTSIDDRAPVFPG